MGFLWDWKKLGIELGKTDRKTLRTPKRADIKLKGLFLVLFFGLCGGLFFSFPVQAWEQLKDPDILEYLYSRATGLSGLHRFSENHNPPIYFLPKADLHREVCPHDPENCYNMVAVFDDIGYRILVRDDFKVSASLNSFDESFIIHELVHYLQYRTRGAEIFKNCQTLYQTELEAYKVQDAHLKREGDFHRMTPVFERMFQCHDQDAQQVYLESLRVWQQRQQNGFWQL